MPPELLQKLRAEPIVVKEETEEEKFLKRRGTFFRTKIDECELNYLNKVSVCIE